MTKEDKLLILKDRLHKLQNNGKNFKSGIIRKLNRRIRNLENDI